jgi:uncharacterized protein (DUF362 family)
MATAKAESRRLSRITRRRFLQLLGGGLAWLATGSRPASATTYRVGVGKLADPYAATRRAVEASGEWPTAAIASQKVIIKPNLVVRRTAETGVTTDPQVVRALVDLALESEARQVFIAESGVKGANFSACGYDFFADYDPQGRVALIDLQDWPTHLYPVAGGMAYSRLYMPTPLMEPDVVFISAAKLKCHVETLATLSMKNLFGLPPWRFYRVPFPPGRFAMHDRGVHQAVVDLNLVRPIDFAVVDGLWGMEGEGPWNGSPVKMELVVAGSNALAVDRVCLAAMGIPQDRVQHLAYAAAKGLGPSDMAMIEVLGDPLPSYAFTQPDIPPIASVPECDPKMFSPCARQHTCITYQVDRACRTRVEIVRTWDTGPWVRHFRTLHDWTERPAGPETLSWDGQDDGGQVVPPGRYTARVQARYNDDGTVAYATGWVWVIGHR